MMSDNVIYAIGDGDNVGLLIETALLEEDINETRSRSESLTAAINSLKDLIDSMEGWEIIFIGGDDIFLKIHSIYYKESILKEVQKQFYRHSGATISFGVGVNAKDAYLNLRRAKARGGNVIVSDFQANHRRSG